jgi:hypothetical protein
MCPQVCLLKGISPEIAAMPNMLNGVTGSSLACSYSTALPPLAGQPLAHAVPAEPMRADRVELSEVTGADDGLEAEAGVRALVNRIRLSIKARDYLTSEKIGVAVDRIHQELLGH